MKAWQVAELGEPATVMKLADLPDPEPGPWQLVVRVLAAAANFPDALMCRLPEVPRARAQSGFQSSY